MILPAGFPETQTIPIITHILTHPFEMEMLYFVLFNVFFTLNTNQTQICKCVCVCTCVVGVSK